MAMNMKAHGFEIREMEMAPQITRRAICIVVSKREISDIISVAYRLTPFLVRFKKVLGKRANGMDLVSFILRKPEMYIEEIGREVLSMEQVCMSMMMESSMSVFIRRISG